MASDLEEGPCFTSAWSFPGLYCTQRVTHTPLLVISRDEELTPTQGSHFYFKTAVIVGKYALRGVKKNEVWVDDFLSLMQLTSWTHGGLFMSLRDAPHLPPLPPPHIMCPSLNKPHWLWGPGLSRQLGTPTFRNRGEAVGWKNKTFLKASFE